MDDDYALALQLQSQLFEDEYDSKDSETQQSTTVIVKNQNEPVSLIDPYWELTDPNPDVRALFLQFNDRFFWGRLAGIEVRWSPRMTLCAGLCCYEGRGGLCSVRLSVPLLKLRPRKDLIETLLHEMIHAYLFVTDNNKDHDGHGPEFHKHMYRINGEAGTSISVYHNFHDEVDSLRQHWWRCNGPCQTRKPYFGYVKRSMNRAPSKNDTWWTEHERTCGGSYTKIKEPENYGKKSKKDGEEKGKSKGKSSVKSMDIRVFGGTGKTLGQPKTGNTSDKSRIIAPKTGNTSDKSRIITSKTGNTSDKSKTVIPKPSATVTSGVLERTSNSVICIDDDDKNSCDNLPGSKTPAKSQVKGKKSNKPVSQGGNISFDKVKRNSVTLPDFSDSEDDEMSRLEEISNREKEHVFGKYNGDVNEGSEEVRLDDEGDANEINFDSDFTDIDLIEIDKLEKSERLGSTSETFSASDNLEKNISTKTDSTDVRAMLRKVWGEKQFNKDTVSGVSNSTAGPLSDIGSRSTSVKRPSTDNDSSSYAKKQKTRRNDNYMIHSASGNDKDSRKSKEDNSKTKVTSPIKNLFDKIRDRQDNSKPTSGSVSDSSVNDRSRLFGETCDKGGNSDKVTATGETDTVPCPICSKVVPASTVNDHLDLCLTLQAIS